MKRIIAVVLAGCALGLAACGGGEEPTSAAAASTAGTSVAIQDFAFAPATIKAKVGQKITWTNGDAAPHTVTAKSGGDLDSGSLAQGESFSFTPSKAGTIAYFCAIHPSMGGTIEVS
jgi:plastocyanin